MVWHKVNKREPAIQPKIQHSHVTPGRQSRRGAHRRQWSRTGSDAPASQGEHAREGAVNAPGYILSQLTHACDVANNVESNLVGVIVDTREVHNAMLDTGGVRGKGNNSCS